MKTDGKTYCVVEAADSDHLALEVNKLIDEDWFPCGGVAALFDTEDGCLLFQAMVKRAEISFPTPGQ